jgi:hypothetical protein
MKAEILVITVSGVDRARAFKENIGFGLQVAYASDQKLRETVHADQFGGWRPGGLVSASC